MTRSPDSKVKHAALEVLGHHYDISMELLRTNEAVIEAQGINHEEYGHDDPEEFRAAVEYYIEAILEGEFEQRKSTR